MPFDEYDKTTSNCFDSIIENIKTVLETPFFYKNGKRFRNFLEKQVNQNE